MAITEITPTAVSLDTLFTIGGTTGTAINAANTMEIPYPKQGKLLVVILSSNAATAPTFTKGYGVAGKALTMTAVGSGVLNGYIFSSDRVVVKTGDGSSAFKGCLQITWAGSSAGYLAAYYLP
jgi:hypothetical protein